MSITCKLSNENEAAFRINQVFSKVCQTTMTLFCVSLVKRTTHQRITGPNSRVLAMSPTPQTIKSDHFYC
jgi:hypothetical protein